jgi:tetratricopeptide (TPR) repeat protein
LENKVVRRLRIIVAVLSAVWLATPVSAQTARAVGSVRDVEGRAIMGATIRAIHPDMPRQAISTSDSKGRWAMLGLRVGTYTFLVDAPGFIPTQDEALVRTAAGPPLIFVLRREPGMRPGALPSNIQAQIAAANMLRDQGRIDQAINVYEEIRAKHTTLTSLNLVIGATYRRKAALEPDTSARRAALERAIECYTDMLKSDPDNDQAKAELASTRAEAARN